MSTQEVITTTKEVIKAAKDSGVEAKVVDMLDAIQNGAIKVGETVVKYSPDVADAVISIVRIDGLNSLIPSLVVFTVSVIIITKLIKSAVKNYKNHGMYELDQNKNKEFRNDDDKCFFKGLATLPFFATGLFTIFPIVNIWNWVAVFAPKLWLAKQIVNQVIK